MTNLLALSWRLLRGGGRRGLLGTWLTLGAVAVSTALLLFAVAANYAFDARGERSAWRNPVATAGKTTSGKTTAVLATRTDQVRDLPITVVDLAALTPEAPVPPGLQRFPKPGEAWLSQGLADLAKELPANELAARFPKPTGILGDEALVHPGELVAVIGHRPNDPVMTSPRSEQQITGVSPTKVADLKGEPLEDAEMYSVLALIASVLMVVPLLVFGGAAARLTVARRDQRLAALRLIGATPGQVVGMTVAEAVIVAFAGALAGTAAFALATPLLGRIEIAGGGWFAGDLWPPVYVVAALLVAVPLLVGLSAVAGLRRVVVSPLGVAKRETPPGMRFVRVLALVGALAMVSTLSPAVGLTVIVIVLSLAFLCINLVGPWVVALIGRITAAGARGPVRLLAGRRLVDDPRSAWRTVSGVALTGFVAGFLGLLSPASITPDEGPPQMSVVATAAEPRELVPEVRARLAEADVTATVKAEKDAVVAALGSLADAATVDRARTALSGISPGISPAGRADSDLFGVRLLGDVRVGTVIVLSVSFLVAIASAGITAASSVLDRRQTYALLRLAGTPLEVLDRARRSETLIPLAAMGGGAIAVGAFCAMPFMMGAPNVTGLITLVVCVVVGFGGVLGAGALSRPLLRSVTADPAPRPD
ncbi:FtsX-like permease family protein [Nonomuraea longicatena]|uniref:ABC3 transporter permease C-terminal domain-containing protein n=1 Tax=Nonomuraea longicatena TaxID=83682 RepID=A0ABP3Z5Z0_9ACTN